MSNRVVPANSVNPNAQLAPGVLVFESLNSGGIAGIPSNVIGAVGTGTWGPVNAPVSVSTKADFLTKLGVILPVSPTSTLPADPNPYFSLGTFVDSGLLQGVSANYICVRVTDGTDVSATSDLDDTNETSGVLLTAIYTGITGNTLQATVTAGSQPNTYNVTIGRPGYTAEIFNNIGGSGATFWQNVVTAINNGQSGLRGPSQLVVASIVNGVNAVTLTNNGSNYTSASVSFTGGGGSGAAATAVLGFPVSTVSVTTPGSYASIPSLSATLGTGAIFTPSLGALTAAPAAAGTGWVPADTISFTGGAVLTVTHTKVVSATVAAGGTGGTPGTQTVTGTTGTGTKFQASVTVSGGGVITAVLSITVAGDYTVNPTVITTEPVTGAGLTGAQLSVVMGVLTTSVTTPGSYTALPSNPVTPSSTSGVGVGFTATISTWKLVSVAVVAPGLDYTALSALVITGGGSTGGGAGTLNLTSVGRVKSITITNSGNNYTGAPTVIISGDGTGAAGTAAIGSVAPPAITASGDFYAFANGTNGNDGVDAEVMLGDDGVNPTGMYVLRNQNCSLFALVGNTDGTTFTDIDSFAGQTGSQAILVGPPGQSVSDAITAKQSAAIEDDSCVYIRGNWCYYLDTNNGGVQRLISPQGFYGGLMGNLSPEQNPLNKPMFGIVGTQLSIANLIPSDADIINMSGAGIEDIDIPSAGGYFFGAQTGKAGGYDLTTNDVNIQRMANFIGLSISKAGVIGAFIGQLQTPSVRLTARNVLVSFLKNLESNGQIKNSIVILDETNNPNSRVVLGFMEAQVIVQLFSIIRVFIINLNVGTVTIQTNTTNQ